MRRIPGYFLVSVVLLFLSTNVLAQSNKLVRDAATPSLPGGVATLYALDPLAHTLCFRDGQEGFVTQYNEIRNRCSDLDFNYYNAGNFTIGVEGGRQGRIIDLGTAEELKQKYGTSERGVSPGQVFVSIRLENTNIVLLKNGTTIQPTNQSANLFGDVKPLETVPIKLGHVYLIRVTDRHDKAYQLFAKMMVVSYTPNESVSVRWQVL
jgi:hypothetical protein